MRVDLSLASSRRIAWYKSFSDIIALVDGWRFRRAESYRSIRKAKAVSRKAALLACICSYVVASVVAWLFVGGGLELLGWMFICLPFESVFVFPVAHDILLDVFARYVAHIGLIAAVVTCRERFLNYVFGAFLFLLICDVACVGFGKIISH
jgi:hypothetical protein